MRDGDWGELTYDFDDVVAALNAVYPYDWASFLDHRGCTSRTSRRRSRASRAAATSWSGRIRPTPTTRAGWTMPKSLDLTYSLGISLDKDGKVTSALWDGPRSTPGSSTARKIVAVNGEAYSTDVMHAAITAAKGTTSADRSCWSSAATCSTPCRSIITAACAIRGWSR